MFAAECALLSEHGHFVKQYSVLNDEIRGMASVQLAAWTIWNGESYRTVRRLIRDERIDLIHSHNTFPIISPALYYAAEAEGVPVVQTLHNYRLLCPVATFFRNGKVCEDCLGLTVPYPAVVHGCYRGSRAASATVAAMLASHRMAGTWSGKVDTYIAVTNFARDKFIEGGLPAGKLTVKPNFLLNDPGPGDGSGGYCLFVGRLSQEKGLDTLLTAWQELGSRITLKIAGDGPQRETVERRARTLNGVEYLGQCEHSLAMDLLKRAALLIFPSEWYEGLPMTVIEAMACGTPVVASEIGSMKELIAEGLNGVLFPAGSAEGLIKRIEDLLSRPKTLFGMRDSTRYHYQTNYTRAANYQSLQRIYQGALTRFIR